MKEMFETKPAREIVDEIVKNGSVCLNKWTGNGRHSYKKAVDMLMDKGIVNVRQEVGQKGQKIKVYYLAEHENKNCIIKIFK